MSSAENADRAIRVAIVGSGPSGFYAAEALQKSGRSVSIDMYDRLPTPFGLVRGGVAPDHPKIKSVTRVFERIAGQPGFRFLGNVCIGKDLSIDAMRAHYDAILLACGAETDRRLGIPGEDLPGSHTATEFVGWYNGHPDYRDRAFDLTCSTAVIIGQGNVAMDVCRILSKTVEELRDTDLAQHALDALAQSAVRRIDVVGRRGPVQAKFTTPELRELGELSACEPMVEAADLELDPLSEAELALPESKNAQRNMAVLEEFAARTLSGKPRRCKLLFCMSPVEIRGEDRVTSIVLERNTLVGEPGALRAQGTGATVEVPCGLVFRSVGYRGVPIPGVPFDARRGLIPNDGGRVLDGGTQVPGLYVAGWIKRGPSGIIGTNKPDSVETVEGLLADLDAAPSRAERRPDAILETLVSHGVRVVSFEDWKRIDAAEIARGADAGRPREKFTSTADMLAALK